MSVVSCMRDKLAERDLNDDFEERIQEILDNVSNKAVDEVGERELAEKALDVLEGNVNAERFREVLQISKKPELKEDILGYAGDKDIISPWGDAKVGNLGVDVSKRLAAREGLIATVASPVGSPARFDNVEKLQEDYFNTWMRHIVDGLKTMKEEDTTIGGLKRAVTGDEKDLNFRNVVRELRGEDPDLTPKEKAMAEGARKTLDESQFHFKMAGGKMSHIEDYFPNPPHDETVIYQTDKDEWVNFVFERLDDEKMIKYDTQEPMTDEEQLNLLRDIYDDITTETPKDADLGEVRRASFNERQAKKRVLHFDSSKSWFEYNQRFGVSDSPFDAFQAQIRQVAKDAALMQRFGPNPDEGARVAKDIVTRKADEYANKKDPFSGGKEPDKSNYTAKDDAKKARDDFDHLYRTIKGEVRSIEKGKLSKGVDTFNNYSMASTLPKALPSVIYGDLQQQFNTAMSNGMAGGKVVARQLENLVNWSKAKDRAAVAAEMGFNADIFINKAKGQTRFFGDIKEGVSGRSEWLSEVVSKYSGVGPITAAGRQTFNIEQSKTLANLSKLTWDELGNGRTKDIPILQETGEDLPKFRETMEMYGITRSDWKVLQEVDNFKSEAFKQKYPNLDHDYELLRPMDIIDEGLAERTGRTMAELRTISRKVRRMMQTEEKFAVPTVDTRSREALLGHAENPTLRKLGELTSMYKSYPMMIMMNNLPRFARKTTGGLTVPLMTATMAGMLSLQTSELVIEGNNFRSLDDPKTWRDAFVRGGGLSFLSDAMFTDPSSPYADFSKKAVGPGFGLAQETIFLGQRGVRQALGQDMNFGKNAAEYFNKWNPPGNMFYTKLVYDRLLGDNLQRLLDEDAHRSFKREMQFMKNEYDQTAYSKPGSDLSDIEAPDPGELTKEVEDGFSDMIE